MNFSVPIFALLSIQLAMPPLAVAQFQPNYSYTYKLVQDPDGPEICFFGNKYSSKLLSLGSSGQFVHVGTEWVRGFPTTSPVSGLCDPPKVSDREDKFVIDRPSFKLDSHDLIGSTPILNEFLRKSHAREKNFVADSLIMKARVGTCTMDIYLAHGGPIPSWPLNAYGRVKEDCYFEGKNGARILLTPQKAAQLDIEKSMIGSWDGGSITDEREEFYRLDKTIFIAGGGFKIANTNPGETYTSKVVDGLKSFESFFRTNFFFGRDGNWFFKRQHDNKYPNDSTYAFDGQDGAYVILTNTVLDGAILGCKNRFSIKGDLILGSRGRVISVFLPRDRDTFYSVSDGSKQIAINQSNLVVLEPISNEKFRAKIFAYDSQEQFKCAMDGIVNKESCINTRISVYEHNATEIEASCEFGVQPLAAQIPKYDSVALPVCASTIDLTLFSFFNMWYGDPVASQVETKISQCVPGRVIKP